jgi:hypothetical protein
MMISLVTPGAWTERLFRVQAVQESHIKTSEDVKPTVEHPSLAIIFHCQINQSLKP